MLSCLGVDIGTNKLGIAGLTLRQGDEPTIWLAETHTIKHQDRIRRCNEAAEIVKAIVLQHKPDLIALEDFIPFRDDAPMNGAFGKLAGWSSKGSRKNISIDGTDCARLIGRLYEMQRWAEMVEVNPMTWTSALGVVRPRAKDFPGGKGAAWKQACEDVVYQVVSLQLGLQLTPVKARKRWDFHTRDALGIALYAGRAREHAIRVGTTERLTKGASILPSTPNS